jgi:hypothetical protein
MASFTEKKKTNINTKNTNKKQQQQTNKIYTNVRGSCIVYVIAFIYYTGGQHDFHIK